MKYKFDGGPERSFQLNENYVAYKNGHCYSVYESEDCLWRGNEVGFVRLVVDERENILAEAYSVHSFNNDFKLFKTVDIKEAGRIYNAWEKFVNPWMYE